MSDKSTERTWKKGQTVILFTQYARYGTDDHKVSVHKIDSVAPKSFKVGQYRFFKDKLSVQISGGGFHEVTWKVCAIDDERAPYLLAERDACRQRVCVTEAQKLWDREQSVECAVDLQSELNKWITAERLRLAAWKELRELRPFGLPLD
jgi:hypothetical protein